MIRTKKINKVPENNSDQRLMGKIFCARKVKCSRRAVEMEMERARLI